MKSTVEAMSGIYAQLIGHDVGILPLVEACNKILDYVLENGFGGGSSNPLTPAQLEKIKKDIIDKIKTQVPIGVMLKDCELIGSKLKYTLSDNSNKELDLATLVNKSVKDYVDTHKAELKGEQGVAGVNGKSAYELWKEKGNIGTEQDFLNSLKGAKGDIGQQGQKGEKGNTGESAFETWKRIKSKPTANETEFLDSLKGAKGDTGNNGAAGVQGQKGNDGIGITNIEKIGDKLKITLSNGQIKEFTLPSGGSGTTGLTEEQVKTLINTFYKPQIDSKLERGSLDKNITADQLKKSIDKNTDKLTQTITDLKLVGDKLRYKENGIEKSIILPSGSGGLTTQQVKQIIDTDYVPTINSKLEKGYYTGNATDLEKSINNKADKIELENYAKKSDISEFIKKTDADDKYNTKKEFDKLKYVATTELSLSGNDLVFKENDIVKRINLPINNPGAGLTESQVKSLIDREYKPSIDSKAEKSELSKYASKKDIENFITETKADSKYQAKGSYASQTELNNKLDKVTYQQDIATLNNSIDSKQDKANAVKIDEVKAEIQKIVGTAPESLNTLQEIAEALGNDPNKINTILTQLGLKADKNDLSSLKEKVITDIRFNNNIITYKENNIDKTIDLSSYVNQSTQDIEAIVENKGNSLFEKKDNTIVKNLGIDGKKIIFNSNGIKKEIELPIQELPTGDKLLERINNNVDEQTPSVLSFREKLNIPASVDISGKVDKVIVSDGYANIDKSDGLSFHKVEGESYYNHSMMGLLTVCDENNPKCRVVQLGFTNTERLYIRFERNKNRMTSWQRVLTEGTPVFQDRSIESKDLNDYINQYKQGYFIISDYTNMINLPVQKNGIFKLFALQNSYTLQEYITIDNEVYSRFYNHLDKIWGQWVLINPKLENPKIDLPYILDKSLKDIYFKDEQSTLYNVYVHRINASGKIISQDEIISSGNVTAFSDIRLKSNIQKIDNALDKIIKINGYTYDMNNKRSSGVIAQEVEKVLPEVVQDRENGYKTVAYGNMVGLLIEAIKELKQEIEVLKNAAKERNH